MKIRNRVMPNHSYSTRGVITIIALFMLITLVLTSIIYVEGRVFDGVRSYVRGEGLWAKAQKDAILSLEQYSYEHLDADYFFFEQAIQVNLGDKQARLALLQSPPDRKSAGIGFLQGQNDLRNL